METNPKVKDHHGDQSQDKGSLRSRPELINSDLFGAVKINVTLANCHD